MQNRADYECHDGGKCSAKDKAECDKKCSRLVANVPRFAVTYCSQCGGEFGPGHSGFSHCSDHADRPEVVPCKECFGKGWNQGWRAVDGHHDGGEVFHLDCELCCGTGKMAVYNESSESAL